MNFEKITNRQEVVIDKFADLRGRDLSKQDLSIISADILKTAEFGTTTIWPEKEKLPADFNPEKLLLDGKNPGLGIRELHQQGIDGRGVVVAIIDQGLDTSHPEYKDSLVDYKTFGNIDVEPISMHGPAVASLLVGKDCGVAPGAKLIYRAQPGGDLNLFAQNLKDLIKINQSRADNERIKIVSCSIGYMAGKTDLAEWLEALRQAKEQNMIVVDANGSQIEMNFTGGGSLEDKDNPESYSAWLYQDMINLFAGNDVDDILLKLRAKRSDLKDIADEDLKKKIAALLEERQKRQSGEILVPSDHRTMASSWSKKNQYMHQGRGGISWSVPYLAGIFALALQVKPDIKSEQLTDIIKETAIVNQQGLRIINPQGIIDELKRLG